MEKNRILYISYDGLTDPLGQSQVLPYLTSLQALNYEIHILSTEKNDNFLKNREIIRELCENSNIKWHWINYTKRPPILSTIKDIRSLTKKAVCLHKEFNFSLLHCRSYISALVGLKMKKKLQLKFLFDMRGFWADERVDGNIWNLKLLPFKKVYNYFKNKEKKFLLNADHVVSLTHNGKFEMRSWDYLQGKEDNITVIPCCADLSHFDYNCNKKDELIKLNLKIPIENKVICYLGSIGTWYMMDEMMDYFKVHLKRFSKTTFLWITKDNPLPLINAAKKRGIEKSICIQPSERKDLPNLLSICEASIFFIKPMFSKKASSPTKMAELLGMGIPLICNSNVGDTDQIVKKENVGIVVNEFNKNAYDNAVNQFSDLLAIPKQHLRDTAKKHFSLSRGVKSYHEIYQKLI
jgi:glycosyltransferase involved in cell wall biosynthesis